MNMIANSLISDKIAAQIAMLPGILADRVAKEGEAKTMVVIGASFVSLLSNGFFNITPNQRVGKIHSLYRPGKSQDTHDQK